MPSIQIHINEVTCQYQLEGDVDILWTNRRARFFMSDYLNAIYVEGQSIAIPFSKEKEGDKEKVLTDIQAMLEKYGFAEELTEHSKRILTNFIVEKERFDEFSLKAKKIWNNEIETAEKQEFKEFTNVLKKEFTNRTLYDLQLLAAYHLTFSQNACNFSVPGAGKTSVVYAAYAYLKSLSKEHKKYVNRLFIVGPLSSFGPWEDEYIACFGERPDIKKLSGGVSRDERIRHFLSPHSAEITLISYQGVASNLDDIISYLRRHENKVMVVLDEAHKIKNTDGGVWAQSILAISKYCKSRVVLTGTPIPKGYEDIYNLFSFIWPDKDIIPYHLFQLKEMTQNEYDSRIPGLIDSLSPFFIRITKDNLKKYMGLPDAIENDPITIKMGPVQRQIYEYIENNYIDYFQSSLDSNESFKNSLLRTRLIRLMQAATNPGLLRKPLDEFYREQSDEDFQDQGSYNERKLSNDLFIDDAELIERIMKYSEVEIPEKFIATEQLIRTIICRGEKVVVWGIFIQNIKELQSYLSSKGVSAKLLIGEIPVELDSVPQGTDTRESIVKEFNDPNSPLKVVIANPFAVAESISLHKGCHNAIYMERNFNAANYLQSKDRIHRVGLLPSDEINYYYVLSESSIDETIHQRLEQKEKRMLRIIESKSIPLINMNMDYDDLDVESGDLKALILDYVRRAAKDR